MWNGMMGNYGGFGLGWGMGWWLFPLLAWSMAWKGMALWRAARGNQTGWFVALLVINTVGILEIVYLFGFAKEKLVLGKRK